MAIFTSGIRISGRLCLCLTVPDHMLAQDSLKAEIVTAKSSEMNVMIPAGEDFVEQVHSLLPIRSNFSNPVPYYGRSPGSCMTNANQDPGS